jgi:ribosome-associated toxin RatA of RatAB toxin-antitoxin module
MWQQNLTMSLAKPILLLLFLLITCGNVFAGNNWQLSKDEEGIQVHVRNTSATGVKSFKGSMTINSRLNSIVALIEDTESYPRWLHNCKKANTLKKAGNNQVYNYIVTKMPWPVADRDAIVHSTHTQNNSTKQVLIELASEPNLAKRQPGLVRITTLLGQWRLTPLKHNQVNVIYEMNVDPGGNIPKWLVNAMAVDLPLYTLKKFRNVVKEAKYVNAKVDKLVD